MKPCEHCVHCLSFSEEKDIVHCSNSLVLETVGDCLSWFKQREKEMLYGEGQGYYIIEPVKDCAFYLDKKWVTPLSPEPQLIHSPFNWQGYKKVKE